MNTSIFKPRHALLALALSTLAAAAQADCSAPADRGACPVRLEGGLVFDRCFGSFNGRPTDIGNTACNALRDTHRLADQVGQDNRKALQQAQADWNALQKVVLAGAIDKDALRDVQTALSVGNEIAADISALTKDPQCGSKAAMDALQRRFSETAGLFVEAAKVAGLTVEAANRLRPVLDEAGKIMAELRRLGDAANKRGGKAKTEADALAKALTELQKEMATLLATDFTAVAGAGGNLVGGVVPFVGECATCATAISVAVSSVVAGGSVTAGGAAACPESAGLSCVLAAVSLPVGGATAAAVDALASTPCVAAAAQMDKLGQYVQDIQKFVDGAAKLANSIPKSATHALTAGQALTRLAAEMGNEGQDSLRAVQASLNAMQPALDAAGNVLEGQIAPKVQRMAGSFVQGLGRDTELLAQCYKKLNRAVAHMGSELGDAAQLLAQASGELVDANKVLGNLAEQSNDGLRAANAEAGREWGDLDKDFQRMNLRIWGVRVGEIDLGKTTPHLMRLATQPDEVVRIAQDGEKLLARAVALPVKALDAGKRAFLDQDRLTIQAKSKYQAGQAHAKKAVIAMAKAKAKAQANLDKAPRMAAVAVPAALQAWPTAARPRLTALNVLR